MKKPPILHPFLFAAFPVLFLLANNLSILSPGNVVKELALLIGSSLVFAFLLWGLVRLVVRDAERAGILCSLGNPTVFFIWARCHGIPRLDNSRERDRKQASSPRVGSNFCSGVVFRHKDATGPKCVHKTAELRSCFLDRDRFDQRCGP